MAQEIRTEIRWDILQSATGNRKLLVIHAYLSVFSEMRWPASSRQVCSAAQQTRLDCSAGSVDLSFHGCQGCPYRFEL